MKNIMMKSLAIMMISLFVAGLGIAVAADNIEGTVVETDGGLALQAADGTYILAGQDLSDMVGKKVKVMGTIEEGDNGKTLNVVSVEEVTE